MTVRRLLAVLAWTLLVVACSTGVWSVIRSAGTGVTTASEVPGTVLGTVRPAGRTATPVSPNPHPHPSAGPKQSPTPTPTRAPSPAPIEVRRTWQGGAGAVVASCRGAAITFRGAQPNSGWRIEVADRGPGQVDVRFSRFQGDDGGGDEGQGRVEVIARCTVGEPRFSTQGD